MNGMTERQAVKAAVAAWDEAVAAFEAMEVDGPNVGTVERHRLANEEYRMTTEWYSAAEAAIPSHAFLMVAPYDVAKGR